MAESEIERSMMASAEVGNVLEVLLRLAAGGNINARNQSGDTALHRAALNGYDEVVALLISLGAEINALNDSGETPLHMAAKRDRESVAKQLLNHGANTMTECNEGHTPRDCAKSGDCHDVEALLDNAERAATPPSPPPWIARTAAVQVGDTVAYSRAFLQATGQYIGDAPQARGNRDGPHAARRPRHRRHHLERRRRSAGEGEHQEPEPREGGRRHRAGLRFRLCGDWPDQKKSPPFPRYVAKKVRSFRIQSAARCAWPAALMTSFLSALMVVSHPCT